MTVAEAITVSAEALRALVGRMFTACGLADDAAERLAQGLVDADLEGVASHGVMLVDMYIERIRRGSVSLENKAEIITDQEGALVLDAGHALGQLTGEQAMAMAVERAKGSEPPLSPFATGSISGPRAATRSAPPTPAASGWRCATRGR